MATLRGAAEASEESDTTIAAQSTASTFGRCPSHPSRPGFHVFVVRKQDVDGRNKSGHDEEKLRHFRQLAGEVESKQFCRISAQDIAFRRLAQERQVVDRARQVEVPVR